MSDLTRKLEAIGESHDCEICGAIGDEAAAEIERRRAENERLRAENERLRALVRDAYLGMPPPGLRRKPWEFSAAYATLNIEDQWE